jgi:hypothetical protein
MLNYHGVDAAPASCNVEHTVGGCFFFYSDDSARVPGGMARACGHQSVLPAASVPPPVQRACSSQAADLPASMTPDAVQTGAAESALLFHALGHPGTRLV